MNQPMPIHTILCAFPIFCPSKTMFDRNKDSIMSFIEYLKANSHYLNGSKGFKLDIVFGGWAKEEIWWNDLKDYIKENLQSKVFRFDKNYGKAKVVNSLVFDYLKDNKETNFLFTMDSDMQFETSQIHFFDRLVLAANVLQEKSQQFFGQPKPFGMIALNQTGECCHWWPETKKEGYTGINQWADYDLNSADGFSMKETIAWPQDGAGIAGGGLFLNLKLWQQIGGYRNFNTSYNGDDGLLLRDIQQSGAGVCVIKTLSLEHPIPTDDPEYRKWKDDCMKSAFEEYDESKFNKSVEEFEKMVNK